MPEAAAVRPRPPPRSGTSPRRAHAAAHVRKRGEGGSPWRERLWKDLDRLQIRDQRVPSGRQPHHRVRALSATAARPARLDPARPGLQRPHRRHGMPHAPHPCPCAPRVPAPRSPPSPSCTRATPSSSACGTPPDRSDMLLSPPWCEAARLRPRWRSGAFRHLPHRLSLVLPERRRGAACFFPRGPPVLRQGVVLGGAAAVQWPGECHSRAGGQQERPGGPAGALRAPAARSGPPMACAPPPTPPPSVPLRAASE